MVGDVNYRGEAFAALDGIAACHLVGDINSKSGLATCHLVGDINDLAHARHTASGIATCHLTGYVNILGLKSVR